MANALELSGVTHRFDGFTLDNVSFSVPGGSIMGFVGQNGVGKTTTIRSILNILKNDSGEIRIFGLDHAKDEAKIRTCLHKKCVRIFEHNFVADKAKIHRQAVA